MTDWDALTQRTLEGIERCDPIYRPTSFWRPAIRPLLDDMHSLGLAAFKSWPTAAIWFYPRYGSELTKEALDQTFEFASKLDPALRKAWFDTALTGAYQARRDFDAVRLAWDQSRWPFDVEGVGESEIGHPPQIFRLVDDRRLVWTRPYLNYLLCLAALSRYVDRPPASFLEIGGGYGVLGEIVMTRDPDARYVNLDLPPLVTVSSWYLDALFGDRVAIYGREIVDGGPIPNGCSASLPNWQIGDVDGPFDVFVNTFSFQEMEPEVVEHYVTQVVAKDVSYVVSLNSRVGKPRTSDGHEIGVIDPVTSERIVAMFEARGYVLLGRHGDPLLQSAGEVAVLGRKDRVSRGATASTKGSEAILRLRPATTRGARIARDWLPPKLLRGLRRLRKRFG
jgi:putative sugar O-methyltransferase